MRPGLVDRVIRYVVRSTMDYHTESGPCVVGGGMRPGAGGVVGLEYRSDPGAGRPDSVGLELCSRAGDAGPRRAGAMGPATTRETRHCGFDSGISARATRRPNPGLCGRPTAPFPGPSRLSGTYHLHGPPPASIWPMRAGGAAGAPLGIEAAFELVLNFCAV